VNRHARVRDEVETREVIEVYVRRLVGRAAQVCTSLKEFRAVRRPIRDTMLKNPELLGLNEPTGREANLLVAEILRQRCQDEQSISGATDCPEVLRGYAALCAKGLDGPEAQDDGPACEVAREGAGALPAPPAALPGASPPRPAP
jgi:hypothetical protein